MQIKYIVEWFGPEGQESSREYVSLFHATNRVNSAPEGWSSQITEQRTIEIPSNQKDIPQPHIERGASRYREDQDDFDIEQFAGTERRR